MFAERIRRVLLVVAVPYAVLLGRVFLLQTGDGVEDARRAVERSRVREFSVAPRRGAILDRAGRPLAWDETGFRLMAEPRALGGVEWECARCGRTCVTWETAPREPEPGALPAPAAPPGRCGCGAAGAEMAAVAPEAVLDLAPGLGIPRERWRALLEGVRKSAWERALRRAAAEPPRRRKSVLLEEMMRLRVVLPDLPRAVALEVYTRPSRYRGLVVDAEPVRRLDGDMPPAVAALVGRTGGVMEEDVAALRDEGFSHSQVLRLVVGRSGIERRHDGELRGTFGMEREVRDRYGHVIAREELQRVRNGRDLTLTLDPALCLAARDALGSRPGAVVLLDPRDGGILALAGESAPGIPGATTPYHPGSVLKPLTALAAMGEGALPEAGSVLCTGARSRPVTCEAVHGRPDLRTALAASCNAYFGLAAIRTGVDPLRALATALHLDRPYGLGMPLEGGGTEWSQESPVGRPWGRTDLANLGVGQGPVDLAPVQVAALYAALANGGRAVVPHLVRGTVPPPGAPVLSADHLHRVRDGLEETVVSGTAARSGLRRLRAAGKTGTAQTGRGKEHLNAWFAGYAPLEDPRVVVVVVIADQPGGGGGVAAPVAARILEAWERGGDPR